MIDAAAAAPARRGGVAHMLAGSAFFAVMATFVALAHARDAQLSTLVSSGVRAVVNMLALILLARGRGMFGDGRPALWARGVLGAVALISYFAALDRLSVGEAAFLNQTSAVWVAAAAPLVLGERSGRVAWIAVLGSLAGIALLVHPRPDAADGIGRILGLLSGFAAAGAYLSIRRAGESNGPIVIVFYFTFVSTLAAVGFGVATGAAAPRDLGTVLLLVGSGLAATVAQLFMTEAYRVGRAAPVAAAGAAGPLLTVLAGWAVLDQIPDGRALVGMGILCVTGIAMPFYAGR